MQRCARAAARWRRTVAARMGGTPRPPPSGVVAEGGAVDSVGCVGGIAIVVAGGDGAASAVDAVGAAAAGEAAAVCGRCVAGEDTTVADTAVAAVAVAGQSTEPPPNRPAHRSAPWCWWWCSRPQSKPNRTSTRRTTTTRQTKTMTQQMSASVRTKRPTMQPKPMRTEPEPTPTPKTTTMKTSKWRQRERSERRAGRFACQPSAVWCAVWAVGHTQWPPVANAEAVALLVARKTAHCPVVAGIAGVAVSNGWQQNSLWCGGDSVMVDGVDDDEIRAADALGRTMGWGDGAQRSGQQMHCCPPHRRRSAALRAAATVTLEHWTDDCVRRRPHRTDRGIRAVLAAA